MYVCSVEWWDLLIYSPSMPRKVDRIYRDEEYIGLMDITIERFLMDLEEAKERLLAEGYRPLGKVKVA